MSYAGPGVSDSPINYAQLGTPADFLSWLGLSGGVSGAQFKGARLSRTNAQSITSGTLTTLVWDTEEFDTDGFFAVGTDPSAIIMPGPLGTRYVELTASCDWATNTSGYRRIVIQETVSGRYYAPDQRPANTTGPVAELTVTTGPILAPAGSTFIARVAHSAGSALACNNALLNAFSLKVLGS